MKQLIGLAHPRSVEELKALFEKITGKPMSPEGLEELKTTVAQIKAKSEVVLDIAAQEEDAGR